MGAPVAFFEVISDDPERSRTFYSEMFGWQASPASSRRGRLPPSATSPPASSRSVTGPSTRRMGPRDACWASGWGEESATAGELIGSSWEDDVTPGGPSHPCGVISGGPQVRARPMIWIG